MAFIGEVTCLSIEATTEDLALSQQEWVIDGGAMLHMSPSCHDMKNFKAQSGDINFGNNLAVPIHGEGTMALVPNGRGGLHSTFVIYCLHLGCHLLSVSKICKLGKSRYSLMSILFLFGIR